MSSMLGDQVYIPLLLYNPRGFFILIFAAEHGAQQ